MFGFRRKRRIFSVIGAIFALGLFAAPASADPPLAFPFEETFTWVNACTGLEETVTVTGVFYVYERGVHGLSHRLDRTLETSSGFTGHGSEISIDHDSIFHVQDQLTNGDGQHLFGQFLFVEDAQGRPRVFILGLRCAP